MSETTREATSAQGPPRLLPDWLDADAAALTGAVPPAATLAAALPGLTRAQGLTPLQRLQHVQRSGLAESGAAGEPIHLAWRRFIRGHGPATLVIDASTYDVRALGPAAVLDRAPWLLAEGVLIAAGLRDSLTIEVRLPAELTGHEAALLNAADAIRSLARINVAQRRIDIQRHCKPSCWAEAPTGRCARGWCTRPRPGAASRCCLPAPPISTRRC